MSAFSKIDMGEVTRLTRSGRLAEAMALLRGGFSGGPFPTAHRDTDEGRAQSSSTIDMTRPSTPGGAWTAFGEQDAPAAHPQPETPAGPDRSEAMQKLRERPPGIGSIARDALKRRRAAPVDLPDGARFEERTFSNAAGSRTYKVYVPSGYVGQSLPIVVMLHGCTQDPDDFAAGTRMNAVAEEQKFLVVYPRQDSLANPRKCWNWFKPSDQRRGAGEPALIAGIVQQTLEEFPADRSRVYVAGLSAGGAAAAVMAAAYPDLFAAVGVHSGLACGAASDIPSAFAAMAGKGVRSAGGAGSTVPTIVFHGDADRTVNLANADQVIAQAKPRETLRSEVTRGESRGVAYTQAVQHDEEGRAILEQWTLHGAGHAWSGGSADGSYADPRGPDASREMVRFFLSHAKKQRS